MPPPSEKAAGKAEKAEKKAEKKTETPGIITIDDFAKVEMTVCKVLACENVKKSEKLLKVQLDDGSGEPRQILSGIAMHYKAEELVGKIFGILTDDTDTGSDASKGNIPAVCYQTGIFNRNAVIVAGENAAVDKYEDDMREASLFLRNVQNYE